MCRERLGPGRIAGAPADEPMSDAGDAWRQAVADFSGARNRWSRIAAKKWSAPRAGTSNSHSLGPVASHLGIQAPAKLRISLTCDRRRVNLQTDARSTEGSVSGKSTVHFTRKFYPLRLSARFHRSAPQGLSQKGPSVGGAVRSSFARPPGLEAGGDIRSWPPERRKSVNVEVDRGSRATGSVSLRAMSNPCGEPHPGMLTGDVLS